MEVSLQINEENKKVYESHFICDGEYQLQKANWFPDIDESLIESYQEGKDGKWEPATPLGYRDYKESRKEALDALFALEPNGTYTSEQLDEFMKGSIENVPFKKYDHFVETKDDRIRHWVVEGDNVDGILVIGMNKEGEYQTFLMAFEE